MPTLLITTEKQELFLSRAFDLSAGERITEEFKSRELSLRFKQELERLMRERKDYSVKVYREGRYVIAKKLFPDEFHSELNTL
jgi:PleD family two-component response regulator